MHTFSTLAVLLLTYIVASTSAFTIVYPSSKYYVAANTTCYIRWTYNASSDPDHFSIELEYPNEPPYAIATTVNSSLGMINWTVQEVPPRPGYDIVFVNIGDINQRYATSEKFEIKGLGNSSSVYQPPSTASTDNTNSSAPDSKNSTNKTSDGSSLSTNARSLFYSYQMALIVIGVVSFVGYFNGF
ncbi:8054_t:CDS:2 [Ambispora leptoticha]|uniref:8054_t:CDS:1 n=1 Tax=Ambispora leptoticha TaxID=144679 RepID=A0A9N9AQ37_9GLOM|nr:8054_t:CDS:2 [Ambispora leptoticha]